MKKIILPSLLLSLLALPQAFAQSCDLIGKVRTEDDLTRALNVLHKEQLHTILLKRPSNRHELGSILNNCQATADSKALVISFEGTGSFDPRTSDIYKNLLRCLDPKIMDQAPKKYLYSRIQKFVKSKSRTPRWSGILAGPMGQFIQNEDLHDYARSSQFVFFPSEETELLEGPNSLTLSNFKKIASDFVSSSSGYPQGLVNAVACTSSYIKSARTNKINPKIIVLSHSSGGRTAVKFLEKLKVANIKVDLVFSMDPVKEAHEAVKEVIEQMSGNAARDVQRQFSDNVEENKPVNVWTRNQPKVLYKPSNAKQWVNVYQNVDELGLKGTLKFGIRGSPVHRADVNKYIKTDLKKDAHGGIVYHEQTLKLFNQYFPY